MKDFPALALGRTQEEFNAFYYKRNAWVCFLFIPVFLGVLTTIPMTYFQVLRLLVFNIEFMCILFIQAFGHEFFDGMTSVVCNSVLLLTSVYGIAFGVPDIDRLPLTYGYCSMLAICSTQRQYITIPLLFCMVAMCFTVPVYTIFLFCFMLMHFLTPAAIHLMNALKRYFLITRLLLFPLGIYSIYPFLYANKFIYIPLLVLLVAEIIYFIPYFKRKKRVTI